MKKPLLLILTIYLVTTGITSNAQHTVARLWNEVLLESIRNDYARPTVHARNLFHISAAMYDCWAVYDSKADPYFLGREIDGFMFDFDGVPTPPDVEEARKEAISYACYRLIIHRFSLSPGYLVSRGLAIDLMNNLGYDINFDSQDYSSGSPAALGNYLAEKIIEFGLQDGSNEENYYANQYYVPVNDPLVLTKPGSQGINDPNRWQPLAFELFIDQAGNEIPGNIPDFLGPEWGNVEPFAFTKEDAHVYTKDGNEYIVYDDPGTPPQIDPEDNAASSDYKWTFTLVSIWSSHLDATDGVMWDVSPGSIGGLTFDDLPAAGEDLRDFYDQLNGGDPSVGYSVNPKTGQPYKPQIVPRGDYCRVLAEFWADGPDSETPPGHWFTILNYVTDHPLLVKKFKGEGDIIDDLEWDVKSYFVLGGAVHDAAVSSWGIKGYYDYIRPISAIRYMADQGQSSDPDKPNYSEAGIPLIPGKIELVEQGDPLAGAMDENVGKIKLMAWRGHDYINNPETDVAGVDWILAENWWPYQRPTFVTPPFAGYVSGHSTYSRAGAKVLSLFTGDEYFPGGMGEFHAPKNEFLVFEDGPTMDVTLQWAKYYDASDQCSLSRIWGGIHPPADDMPGRKIGEKIGTDAFEYAEKFFNGTIILGVDKGKELTNTIKVYPNPVAQEGTVYIWYPAFARLNTVQMVSTNGKIIDVTNDVKFKESQHLLEVKLPALPQGIYVLNLSMDNKIYSEKISISN